MRAAVVVLIAGLLVIATSAALLAWALFVDRATLATPPMRVALALAGVAVLWRNVGGYRPAGVSLLALGLSDLPRWTAERLIGMPVATPIVLVATFSLLLSMVVGIALVLDREFRRPTDSIVLILDRWPYAKPILLSFGSAAASIVGLVYSSEAADQFSGSVQLALVSSVLVGVVGIIRTDRRIGVTNDTVDSRPPVPVAQQRP
jgi:hypothetical protein